MPGDTQHGEGALRVAESRLHPRLRVNSLAYIELSEENAGLILNISETGIAVQAVQVLSSSEFPRMRFRLPGTEIPVEAAGRMVWQIRSKKEVGIEFVDLPETARAQIRDWIAGEPLRMAAAIARSQQKDQPTSKTPQPEQPTAANRRPAHQTPRQAPAATAPASTPGSARQSFTPVSPSRLRLALEAQYRKIARTLDHGSTPARDPQDMPSARWAPADDANSHTPPASASSTLTESPFGHDSRTAPEEHPGLGPDRAFWERRYAKRATSVPRWRYVGPDMAAPFRRPRPWRTYLAVLGFIAAIGFAGYYMMLDPNAVTRARIEALTHQVRTLAEGAQPAQNHATSGSQPAAPSGTNSADSGRAAQPATAQPSAGQPKLPAASAPSSVPDQPRSDVALPSSNDTSKNSAKARSSRANSKPPASNKGTDRTQSQPHQSRAPEPSQNRVQIPNSPAAPVETQKYQPQAATPRTYSTPTEQQRDGGSSAGDKPPVNPLSLSSAQPPARRDQDAYARPSSNTPATVPSRSAPPKTSSVELPSYQSSPVTPSVPLSGVPSGSVGATSRFHAIRVPPELQSKSSQLAGNLQIGQLISSYSPAYPIEAAREGIEGTVKLDVLVGRDGTVRSAQVLSGPPMLASAAADAVRDWRYGETVLAGQPIETQQYVTLVFRLAK